MLPLRPTTGDDCVPVVWFVHCSQEWRQPYLLTLADLSRDSNSRDFQLGIAPSCGKQNTDLGKLKQGGALFFPYNEKSRERHSKVGVADSWCHQTLGLFCLSALLCLGDDVFVPLWLQDGFSSSSIACPCPAR